MPLNTRTWRRFFNQSIIVVQRHEEGLYREKVETTGVDLVYAARVEKMTHKVRTAAGEELVADGTVFLMEIPSIQLGDQIQLPDGTTPLVLAIDSPEDIGSDEAWYLSIHYGRDVRLGGP